MNVGDIVEGKISQIFKTHFIVDLENGWKGLVHVSKISDYYVLNIGTMFKIGEKLFFKVIEVEEDKKVKLSWKDLMPRFVKDPFEFKLAETEGGFKNLSEFTQEMVLEETKND